METRLGFCSCLLPVQMQGVFEELGRQFFLNLLSLSSALNNISPTVEVAQFQWLESLQTKLYFMGYMLLNIVRMKTLSQVPSPYNSNPFSAQTVIPLLIHWRNSFDSCGFYPFLEFICNGELLVILTIVGDR